MDADDNGFSAALESVHGCSPGFVARFASLLGQAGIHIATFRLGREAEGDNAIALVEVDGAVPPDVLAEVHEIPNVQQVKPLQF